MAGSLFACRELPPVASVAVAAHALGDDLVEGRNTLARTRTDHDGGDRRVFYQIAKDEARIPDVAAHIMPP